MKKMLNITQIQIKYLTRLAPKKQFFFKCLFIVAEGVGE